MFITKIAGTIEYVNQSFCESSGYSENEIIGKKPRMLKSGEHDNEFYKNIWETILSGKTWNGNIKNRHKFGHVYEEVVTIKALKDGFGSITHFMATRTPISNDSTISETTS